MALSSAAVTVATTATPLHTGSTNPQRVVVYNNDASVTMFVGAHDVTTSTGIAVAAGKSFSLLLQPGEVAFGIVATGTLNARLAVSKL
jgi:hypothetical protein